MNFHQQKSQGQRWLAILEQVCRRRKEKGIEMLLELLLERLKQEAGKDIWICGGANLVQQLVSKNMIDKYYISVIPTLLGNGVRLLGNIDREIKLRLCKTQTYNGITDLIYMRR